jgi:hypothetical protein
VDTTSSTSSSNNSNNKRSAEMADLVVKGKEAKEVAQWFTAMIELCDTLSGFTLSDVALSPQNNGLIATLLLWDRHELVISLAPSLQVSSSRDDDGAAAAGSSGGESRSKDVVMGATLTTHFETISVKDINWSRIASSEQVEQEELGIAALLGTKSSWKTKVFTNYVSTDANIDISDLVQLAKSLPPPYDVQLLIREVAVRVASWPERCYHFQKLRQIRQCIVNPSSKGCLVTLPVGVVVSLNLSPDYPRSSGAVVT